MWPWGVLVTLFLYSCIHPSATPENHPILSSLFRCAGLRQATKQLSIRRLPPLLAVVCHKGDIAGGHYISYVKVSMPRDVRRVWGEEGHKRDLIWGED